MNYSDKELSGSCVEFLFEFLSRNSGLRSFPTIEMKHRDSKDIHHFM